MAQVSLPYTLTAGTPENVNNLMSNLNALVAGVNTVDTAQIAAGSVTATKLDSTTLGLLNAKSVIHVCDEKASATAGGTFTSGSWQTRVLNTTKTNTITSASLGSNQITLPAGTYWVDASAPALKVDSHRLKLYNTTAAADVLLGTTEYCVNANNADVQNRSFVRGAFTLSTSSALELRHRCTVTYNTNGFGSPSGLGAEVYTDVVIWRTA